MKPLTALPNGADAGWEMGKGFTWAWPEVAPQARGLRSWPKIAAALRYTPAVGGDFALQAAPTDDRKQTATEQHKSHPMSPCHGHRCPSWMLTGRWAKQLLSLLSPGRIAAGGQVWASPGAPLQFGLPSTAQSHTHPRTELTLGTQRVTPKPAPSRRSAGLHNNQPSYYCKWTYQE